MKSFLSRFFKANDDEDEPSFKSLNIEERDMIRGVVELSDTNVKEIMVPRIDVVSLAIDMDQRDLYQKIIESGHSRFPVYQETIDNVTGILYAKDLLINLAQKNTFDIKSLSRNAYFVPESMKLDALLREMKRRRVHIAVVVDEYGGMSGIVCMEDILEEIIGDIQDEFDNEREDVIKIGEGIYLCDARVNIDDLNEEVGIALPFDDFDTLGGFVFDLFGKIPVKFEKVEKGNLTFIIQEMDGHKIRSIKLLVSGMGDEQ
jgi:magnesium and cobalt transporter